jgi:Ran-binding protein 1
MSEQTGDALAPRDEEPDVHFEPVIKLTEQVDTKTHEEDEVPRFKMRAKLFRFESSTKEWKERGTGDVKLLAHKETKRVRLVMRRDKTLKVCANHAITSDMRLQPNIGSDRSWVWKVAADYAESPPSAETLAIRFANSDHAGHFKTAFEDAQKQNVDLASPPAQEQHKEESKPVEPETSETAAERAADDEEAKLKAEEAKVAAEEATEADA